MGLNLIGASRLILFDVDWNPAVEEQAMARIHREGQKKHCRIYRFVMKGGLEERVWQRQVVKRGLASSIMQGGTGSNVTGVDGSGMGMGKKGVAQFSREELRDLFRLDESVGLRTHELMGCGCQGKGRVVAMEQNPVHLEIDNDNDKPFFVEAPNDINSRTVSDTDTEKDEDDDEDTESLPDLHAIVKASAFPSTADIEAQESRIAAETHPGQLANREKKNRRRVLSIDKENGKEKAKEEAEVQGLMEYMHINTSTLCSFNEQGHDGEDSDGGNVGLEEMKMEASVDDDILMDVLRGDGEGGLTAGIAWVFKKTSSGGAGTGKC